MQRIAVIIYNSYLKYLLVSIIRYACKQGYLVIDMVQIVYLHKNDQILVVACIHKYSSGNIARVKSTSFLYYIVLKVSYTDASLVLRSFVVCTVVCR
jgi:hypothetical protein